MSEPRGPTDMNDLSAGCPSTTRSRWAAIILPHLQRWHRAIGLIAAFFLFVLAGTGLLLLYSDALHLPSRQLDQAWLMNWYGIHTPASPRGFQRGPHWVTQLGQRLYYDTREIGQVEGVLLGVFDGSQGATDEWFAITDAQLLACDDTGAVLERVGREAGLPAGVISVGRDVAGHIVLASTEGRYRYQPELGEFTADSGNAVVHWSAGTTPPAAIIDVIGKAYRGQGLALERVVLDLHSGRLFGRAGALLVTCASLALVFLAASGVFIRVRRWQRG